MIFHVYLNYLARKNSEWQPIKNDDGSRREFHITPAFDPPKRKRDAEMHPKYQRIGNQQKVWDIVMNEYPDVRRRFGHGKDLPDERTVIIHNIDDPLPPELEKFRYYGMSFEEFYDCPKCNHKVMVRDRGYCAQCD